MLLALAVIVAVVGGIGLMGALSISVVERTKEIGVLRAVGARSRTIMGMFVMEGVLQGLFSWIMAVPLSFALGSYMAKTLGQVMFSANLDYRVQLFCRLDLAGGRRDHLDPGFDSARAQCHAHQRAGPVWLTHKDALAKTRFLGETWFFVFISLLTFHKLVCILDSTMNAVPDTKIKKQIVTKTAISELHNPSRPPKQLILDTALETYTNGCRELLEIGKPSRLDQLFADASYQRQERQDPNERPWTGGSTQKT